jgi:type 1 glutamine amidotransferase
MAGPAAGMTMRLAQLATTLLLTAVADAPAAAPAERVLVFTRTAGFRHDSIPAAVAALRALSERHGLALDHTEDAAAFNSTKLGRYRVVAFANTTGDILDEHQQRAFEGYVAGGGGYLGLHSAADTEHEWQWYGTLVGAYFQRHPPGFQTGTVSFELPVGGKREWRVTDEFYDFRDNPRARVRVIATLDERTYGGGGMGDDHPIAWCQTFTGGRSWYTGIGHRLELYTDPTFLEHLEHGLLFAAGLSDGC